MNTLALTKIDIPLNNISVTNNALSALKLPEIFSALERHARKRTVERYGLLMGFWQALQHSSD